ncbi:EAL domain-containing protein [Alterisphingorhabdus coralli]|uniref:EAL domain-containing protein n=1 Tax=Alterisphingorhabdus coralli TaxID=3071408 RepID=A0AA97F9Q1_9SPHN|nr:EAL domain-containing protein [Parasphingorhabdus sp. SCSIO 66989]WOE76116.1 EAL domain-containing protein [Parasphingorhabdus sp. SCSIO 66989]
MKRLISEICSYWIVIIPAAVLPVMRGSLDNAILIQSGYIALATLVIAIIQRRHISERFRRKRDNAQAIRAVNLIKDFEEKGLGWFWETDRHGNISYISPPVAEKIAKSADELVGTPIKDLIAKDVTPDDDREERTLGFHLSSRTAFSDLSLKVAADEERWWSISGNPIIDRYGNFRGFRGSGTDLTGMRESQNEIQKLARYDTLTGLPNRLEINHSLEKALRGPMGKTASCALFQMDLDRFKQVNDTMGHPVGDALLQQVAKRLVKVMGNHGQVGRLGGDEFQVVLPKYRNREELAHYAHAIIERLSQPYAISGSQVRIGASIGIAMSDEKADTTAALVRNADLALYAAKDGGRGAYRFYEADMHSRASERQALENDLREALNRNELFLVYQPVINVASETISGFEALVRWKHPVHGMISPELFIGIAEEAGLITQIGEWILRSACTQLAQWPSDIRVAVNVSTVQFATGNLPLVLTNALAANKVKPSQLELEITESVFLDESESNIETFNRIKRLGVRLALDDFGTGYSALGYLKKVPFDKIKIDQSFVRGATQRGSMNSAIIASIVSLANALKMDTTAEGAETLDELDLVRQLGCSHIQGYIYGKPMPGDQASALLESKGRKVEAQGFRTNREKRHRTYRNIRVWHDGFEYPALARNISEHGIMMDGGPVLQAGDVVTVMFDETLMLDAEVRWCEGIHTGMEFQAKLDFSQLGREQQPVTNDLGVDVKDPYMRQVRGI